MAQPPSETEIDTESNSNSDAQLHITGQTEECELSDPDRDISVTDVDQALSEEQTYKETMHGIRSYMG